jgi:hypothetical protein
MKASLRKNNTMLLLIHKGGQKNSVATIKIFSSKISKKSPPHLFPHEKISRRIRFPRFTNHLGGRLHLSVFLVIKAEKLSHKLKDGTGVGAFN